MIVEGPHGGLGNTLLASFSSVMLVAGGSGITHSLALAHDLLLRAPTGSVRARTIDLVWIIRTEDISQPLMPTLLDMVNDAREFENACRFSSVATRRPSEFTFLSLARHLRLRSCCSSSPLPSPPDSRKPSASTIFESRRLGRVRDRLWSSRDGLGRQRCCTRDRCRSAKGHWRDRVRGRVLPVLDAVEMRHRLGLATRAMPSLVSVSPLFILYIDRLFILHVDHLGTVVTCDGHDQTSEPVKGGPADTGKQTQFAPPPGPPPAPPAYIQDVSMNDTANYNSDAHLLAACPRQRHLAVFRDANHRLTRAFRNFLLDAQRRYPASYITVGLCTDDPATVDEYESSLDNGIPHLDVMSAYEDERREIRRIQGRRFGFTYADWTVKFLLGSRVKEWDSLDERRLTKREMEMIQKFGNAYLGVSGGAAGSNTEAKKKKDCVIM
ncbi:hypothetical protein VNO80_33229 [Phaseolus coccineus]|uniref:Ferric reductase NAD binding domain-containing protein n=1 Tax=Phaseolus coccineus TaxID=3886 RepID=A0AAN9L233_PHACN